jgi:HSP20 family protein
MPDETSLHTTPDAHLDSEAAVGGTSRRWVIVRHTTVWHPPTDVFELNERLVVMVEIAGMRDTDFNVSLLGQSLIISGMRQRMTPSDCAYHQLEIPFGDFRTEVSLPWPVSRDEVTASYRDGFLRVELPHAPAQKIQIVNVDVDESGEGSLENKQE